MSSALEPISVSTGQQPGSAPGPLEAHAHIDKAVSRTLLAVFSRGFRVSSSLGPSGMLKARQLVALVDLSSTGFVLAAVDVNFKVLYMSVSGLAKPAASSGPIGSRLWLFMVEARPV